MKIDVRTGSVVQHEQTLGSIPSIEKKMYVSIWAAVCYYQLVSVILGRTSSSTGRVDIRTQDAN